MTAPVVLVLYYSTGGSTTALAKQVARGVARAGGEAMLRTVPPVAPSTEKPYRRSHRRAPPTPPSRTSPPAMPLPWAPPRASAIWRRP